MPVIVRAVWLQSGGKTGLRFACSLKGLLLIRLTVHVKRILNQLHVGYLARLASSGELYLVKK